MADLDADNVQAQDFQLQDLSSHIVLLTYLSHQVHAQTQTQYNWALQSHQFGTGMNKAFGNCGFTKVGRA